MFNFGAKKIPQISADEVKKAIEGKEDVFLLDVRTPGEYADGKIQGSVNLSVDQVASKIVSLIPDKEKKIYVYCLSGSRSTHAVDTMIKLGYRQVYNMTSGLLAWRIKRYTLV